jgi:hypothetical protein
MGGHQADIPSGRYSRTRREACLVWMIDASSKAVAGCRDPAHHGEICRIVAVHAYLLQPFRPVAKGRSIRGRIMASLAAAHDAAVQMIDISTVRVHQHAA